MIYINRPAPPSFIVERTGRWALETGHAIAHYSSGATASFEFKLYNDTRVKDELRKIFSKCAYCESSYGAVFDGDVEHFRPKGRVNEKMPQSPGYFWLCNEWNNLYLACQHCNQRRRHILFGEDELKGYGKLDQFPLSSELYRSAWPNQDIQTEEQHRLLIDPCKDDPQSDLAYEETEAVIVPLTEKGKKSVEVFVLQRPLLVHERKKQLTRVLTQMQLVSMLLSQLNLNPDEEHASLSFESALEILLNYTKASEPYAGMSRFFVKRFLTQNGLL